MANLNKFIQFIHLFLSPLQENVIFYTYKTLILSVCLSTFLSHQKSQIHEIDILSPFSKFKTQQSPMFKIFIFYRFYGFFCAFFVAKN